MTHRDLNAFHHHHRESSENLVCAYVQNFSVSVDLMIAFWHEEEKSVLLTERSRIPPYFFNSKSYVKDLTRSQQIAIDVCTDFFPPKKNQAKTNRRTPVDSVTEKIVGGKA